MIARSSFISGYYDKAGWFYPADLHTVYTKISYVKLKFTWKCSFNTSSLQILVSVVWVIMHRRQTGSSVTIFAIVPNKSVPWDDVTVPSGDSKSLWVYSNFPPWLVLTACSQWLLHMSCLITRQHLDTHRAICRNLCRGQRDGGPGCRGFSVQEQG